MARRASGSVPSSSSSSGGGNGTPPSTSRSSASGTGASAMPSGGLDIILSLCSAYLLLPARKKAMFYLVWIFGLSVIASLLDLPAHHYFMQKHNVFNQYGVKLGWFWTCVTVGPFLWSVSRALHKDRDRSVIEIGRLIVATILWYATVAVFHRIRQATSYCDTSILLGPEECIEKGGKWHLGLDISGHCFLMVYSILILTEEAVAYRMFEQLLRSERREEGLQYASKIYFAFAAMAGLHLVWDVQLVISTLYYHILFDKVAGVGAAVGCWSLTYRILYPNGFLYPPFRAEKKPKSPRHTHSH